VIQDRWQLFRGLPGILLCLTLCGIFLPLLAGQGLAFRDTAHFYSPSFAWQVEQWRDGSIPLWNDQEGLGTDVVGDGSSSVFYPGKLLLVALPFPWATRLNLYILAHLLLAAAGSYRLAGSWKLGRAPAFLAATAYSLSGPVLSLHANIPFLVGAAWLPWAIQALDQLLRRGQRSAILSLALVLALMVLGGDPQAAYHVGLAGGLYLLMLPRRISGRSRRQGLALLASAALLASLLSAIQLLPLLEQSRQSTRAVPDNPRSIYELRLEGQAPKEQLRGLLGQADNPHQPDPYEFSVSPWRLAELAWPNLSGRLYPQNERWLRAMGGEGRIWSPALYMGLLVMVLAWCGWSLRSSEPRVRWLSWLLLLSGIASLGLYGIGWGLRQAGMLDSPGSETGTDPAGGLYWLMVVFLPGYAKFRFPAKLWVLFTLAASLLAAWQMQRLLDGRRHRPARRLAMLAGAGAAGLLLVLLLRPWLLGLFGQGPSDYLLGPLQADAAWRGILLALAHGTLLALLLLALLANLPSGSLGPLLVSLTILEMAVANSWLVHHAPGRSWETPSPLEILLEEAAPSDGARPPERMFRAQWRRWKPRQWIRKPSPERLAEAVRWDRQTLLPRYQLLSPVGSLESSQSLQDRTLATLLDVGRQHGTRRPDGLREPDASLLRSLGVRWIAGPGDWHPGGSSLPQQLPHAETTPTNFALWRIPSPAPFAHVVFRARQAGPLPSRMSNLARQVEAEFYPDGELVNLTRLVILHGESPSLEAGPSPAVATAHLDRFEPTRRELTVQLDQPGYLVLNQAYAPGWKAWSRHPGQEKWQAVPLQRANFVSSALPLPAGRHQLLLRYQPATVHSGAWLSLAGFILLWILQATLRWRASRDRGRETG
jgi:hypothetical protein